MAQWKSCIDNYTKDYGRIEYPILMYQKYNEHYGIIQTLEDKTYAEKIQKKHLGERWLICHIQNAYDGDPRCPPSNGGTPVVNYGIFMDNFGQVWKIYTELGTTNEQKRQVIELNDSLYPLSNNLIDLAKATMSSWLGRVDFKPHDHSPPTIPPKCILDCFIGIAEATYNLHTGLDDKDHSIKQLEFELEKLTIRKKND